MAGARWVAPLFCALALLVACGAKPAAPPPPKAVEQVTAFVVDAKGPVPGLDVRLVELPDGRCPCKAAPDEDTQSYGNDTPACRCPEALSAWHRRLATCGFPARAVSTVTTNERGLTTLSRSRGVNGIEVTRDRDLRWMKWPTESMPISIELAESISPRVVIAGDRGVPLHGAFLFDDGHCVPLDRQGDAWGPRVPLPRLELADGTLVIEAKGYRTIVYSLFDEKQIDLELRQDDPIAGTCDDGVMARLDSPFQHLVTKLDASKQWSFTGVLSMGAKITCWEDSDNQTDEYDYDPEYGIQPGGYTYTSSLSGNCDDVKVVDQFGKPVAGASLMVMHDWGGGMSSGESGGDTDARGIACVELSRGATLEINGPSELGGSCAGSAEIELTAAVMAKQPYVFSLHVTRVRGTVTRGRVVSAEGAPVAGAYLTTTDVQPLNPDTCTDGGGAATTGTDGRYELPELPRGTLTVTVEHDWYAKQEFTIKNDGTPHDIVIARGATWTGRVLDPEGHAIEGECTVFIRFADSRLKSTECKDGTFSFGALSPGTLQATVRIQKHALGTYRNLVKKIDIAKNEAHVEDLAFPRGEDISGRVLDTKGAPVPGARMTALPTGTMDRSDRFDDAEVMLEADANGRFTFRHLTPGTWTIKGDRRTRLWKDVDVKTGTRDLVLVVPDPPAH